MRRTSVMTLGFVLFFVGIQLNLVESYVLTPRVSSFLAEHQSSNPPALTSNSNQNTNYSSPYYQASYPKSNNLFNRQESPIANLGKPKTVTPPGWICWPVLFLGAVVFLHGFSMPKD